MTSVGLTSKEAIVKLKTSIEEELEKYQHSPSLVPAWVWDAFHHESPHATFPWTSALLLGSDIFLLVLFQVYGDAGSFRMKSLAVETFFLFFLLLFNVFLAGWDSRLRHTEMLSRIKSTLKQLEGQSELCLHGNPGGLHTPPSPCISQQWTFRDGHLLQLPCALLVEGDLLLLRPGHPAPGRCRALATGTEKGAHASLKRGQIFAPTDEEVCENFSSPRLRKPARPEKFVMMETPCIAGIRCALDNALKRPVTLFNKEYHAVVFYYVERIILPATLMVVLCAGSVRAVYFDWRSGEWAEHLLLRPLLSTLPALPLALPLCWTLLNAAGNAQLLGIVTSKQCTKPVDPFDETDVISPETRVRWWEVRRLFGSLLLGEGGHLWRSANLLQVLGSITALCCVDKKGILSWPNPTAEKVFFLKSPRSKSGSSEDNCLSEEDGEPSPAGGTEDRRRSARKLDVKEHIYHPASQVEVLDLTHNLHSPFGIQFDDPNWKFYADNLKPLGLGILLNTCNPKAQDHYTTFSDHIACESLYSEAAVPVVNKRCLCELAKQIGFSDSVVDFYDLEQLLGIFRHVHPEIVQKGKLARTLNFPRLKMPFPNMSCAIVRDLHRGSNQLFSQGTADLILDACNEFWDGNDIRLLTDSDRKRILDFYHRSSLTAHCMGYAYSPLNNALPRDFTDMYVELPAEGHHLLNCMEGATASPRSWDPPCPPDGCSGHPLNRHLSSDSLVLPEQTSEPPEGGPGDCLRQLGNGIFIGMVTMQYQACPDFVQLIEQLDKACIRFVHFSKENELRSRVFSEKMGLESGWNCHISLLSDDTSSKTDRDSSALSPLKFSRNYVFPGTLEEPAENRNEVTPRHASAPSVIHLEDSGAAKSEELSSNFPTEDSVSICNVPSSRAHAGMESHRRSLSSIQDLFATDESNLSHSPSRVTESTEQSAPVTFDMSNRAKLPKGTENIRPHIANVDNVPLQVSLFTDCTAATTREMVCIMQEYGEVVCCLGSAASTSNLPLFLQADASIAIEPLLPQLCIQRGEEGEGEQQRSLDRLSSSLNSLPCGLLFHRDDPISLHQLIMEARHFMSGVRNGLEFLLCCCLCLVVVQVGGVVFFLPLPLPTSHLIWMACLELPLLAVSLLLDSPAYTSAAHSLATGKNLRGANRQATVLFCACFCAKFCPSVVVCLFSFACILSSACTLYLGTDSRVCWVSSDLGSQKKFSGESWFAALTVSQNVISFFLITYFVIISMSFVHRSHLLWKSNPLANKYWLVTVACVLCLHLVFSVADIALHVHIGLYPLDVLRCVPYYVWLLCALWPFLALPLNELVKRHEIKVSVRQQKRARLEFCTKLGMNSPF